MDFSYTEDEQALRELSRKILEDHITQDRLREVEGSEDRIDRKAWSALAEANLLGVALPEEYGGSDLGFWRRSSSSSRRSDAPWPRCRSTPPSFSAPYRLPSSAPRSRSSGCFPAWRAVTSS